MAKKPPGLDRFTAALQAVAGVAKADVEAKVAASHGTGCKGASKRLKNKRKKK